MRTRGARFRDTVAGLLAGALALGAMAPSAQADSLYTEPVFGSRGYSPVEELAYETIVEPGDRYDATLRLRVTLRNTSSEPQDAVLHLALPQGARLEGLSVGRDGRFADGDTTSVSPVAIDRKQRGAVYARLVDPSSSLPSAEVVLDQVPSEAIVQVELELRVRPTHRGGRWHVDLPRRNTHSVGLATDRRVLLRQGKALKPVFWVDDVANDGAPFMISQPGDVVTVSWPARMNSKGVLEGRVEYTPDTFGKGGRFRMVLHLGEARPASPDHVLLAVDRSTSTPESMQRDTVAAVERLFNALPAGTTFDAIAFDRHAQPLLSDSMLGEDMGAPLDDPAARGELARRLGSAKRSKGTDLRGALELAGRRLAARKAKSPLVVVITDGMVPLSGATELKRVLSEPSKKTRSKGRTPEVLFVVDDPILAQRGLSPRHPVAQVAGVLGARVSLKSLQHLAGLSSTQKADPTDLLAAPRVLGHLSVGLPRGAVFDQPLPTSLVAGSFVVAEGTYAAAPPRKVLARGKLGGKGVAKRLTSVRERPSAEAFVASTESEDWTFPKQEGFAFPDWYTGVMNEEAMALVRRAGGGSYRAQGTLDQDVIRYYLTRRVFPRTRACYGQALARHGLQGGRAILEMEVGKGEVMLARLAERELSHPDPAFESCLTEAAWAFDVPAGKLDDKVYVIRYPVRFTPPEDGKAPSANDGNDEFVDMLVRQADVLAR